MEPPLPQRQRSSALCPEWPEAAKKAEVFLQVIRPPRFVGTGGGRECGGKKTYRVVRFRPVGPILYTGRIRRCLVRGPHTECNNLTIPCGSTQPDSATHPPSVIYKKGVLVAVVSGVAPFILKGVYSDSQCGIRKVVVNYIDFPCPSPVSKSK